MIYFWQELEVAVIERKFIDWEYSSNLSLMSISSYVEYETGNMHVSFLSTANFLETIFVKTEGTP